MAIVPATDNTYTGDGTTTQFAIGFEYLEEGDVYVNVNEVPVVFTFATPGIVNIAPAPANGAVVRVFRSTAAIEVPYEFTDGAPFLTRYADFNWKTQLFAFQESWSEFSNNSNNYLRTLRASSNMNILPDVRANSILSFDGVNQPALKSLGTGLQFTGATLDARLKTINGIDLRGTGNVITLPTPTAYPVYDSVAELVSATDLTIGALVQTIGYHGGWAATVQGPVGGNVYEIVAAGTGTVDGGKFINLVGSTGQAKGLFLDGQVTPYRFGAKGEGINDDTAAIRAMHASGFLSLYYPAGAYKITGTITIPDSTLSITGDGPGVSRIEPTIFSGDVFRFTSSQVTRLLVDGIAVRTVAGNKSTGATFGFTGTVTNALFNNLYLRHYYDAFRFDSDINKCYFSWITLDQFGRTVETNANCSFNFVGKPVDVHMIGIQGSGFSGGSADPNKINSHFKMGAVDGLYVMNSHFFYADQTVIFDPAGTDAASSCAFDQVYFDTCRLNHVFFTGDTTGVYQDMKFTSCVFRDATAGPSINIDIANTSLDQLKFSNCTFRDNAEGAIYDPHPYGNLNHLVVSGCTFDGNNYSNIALSGDIITRGDNANINGNTHIGGGAAGKAILFFTGAQFNIVSAANLQSSTAGGITNSGSGNEFHGIIGIKVKNKGFATILSGSTSVVVTHGLHFTPSDADIVVGYSSSGAVPATANLYVNNITATQFTIVMTSVAASNHVVKWRAELW